MKQTRRAAGLVLGVALAAAPGAAAVPCGTARPGLESVETAEGLVIAPDGTIYFSQPFVGANQQYLARYRPPYDQPPETRWVDLGGNTGSRPTERRAGSRPLLSPSPTASPLGRTAGSTSCPGRRPK